MHSSGLKFTAIPALLDLAGIHGRVANGAEKPTFEHRLPAEDRCFARKEEAQMRQNFKVFDSDTHLAPNAETLEPYFDANIRKRLPEWESFKVPFRVGWTGEILQPPYRHRYQFKNRSGWRQKLRILGEAGPREQVERHHPKFMGSRFPTPGGSDDNVEARIRDMDERGVSRCKVEV
jgi:hypothetical protein